ncbi:MAG: TetR/AcrR family transcriptional regulator [Bacteroidota bacterium]
METKDRIIAQTHDLFMRYGIRSVSMDDIAYHLGISKKTIYQFYEDKDALVEGVLDIELNRNFEDCERNKLNKQNSIHEFFLSMDTMKEMFKQLNPTIIHDIQKYHPKCFRKLNQHKQDFFYNIIKDNLELGIKEGLYRPEINIDILTKFHLETFFITTNSEIFPVSKYNLTTVGQEILENFLYGIATTKGIEKIDQYKQERQKQ